MKQIQEDLPQEQEDNKHEPEEKKLALQKIINDYNVRFATNHRIEEFDLYYQDVQKRIKDQKYPNSDLPRKGQEKIDITIVVDMLLTGFDSQYLNTLYVDKNLKHHGLIQAFSRTNRVLNDTKPYGHILDFRGQQDAVDNAIKLFSGASANLAREIWIVEKAPVIIDKLKAAKETLISFMKSQGLDSKPTDVANLKGDAARVTFVKHFKEVQRLQTQLDQYTDLTADQETVIATILPKDELNAFRGQYLETAQRLKANQTKPGEDPNPEVDAVDFEFVLFASATIDYDYIMRLIADFSTTKPGKKSMSREELIGIIAGDSKFLDERDEITEYVRTLKAGEGLDEASIRAGFDNFKRNKSAVALNEISKKHELANHALQAFVDTILLRKIFDGEQLTELLAPLELGWKARTQKELALMADLIPLLKKRAAGREISGLSVYEQ